MINLFQQIECKIRNPIYSGWYHTNKGFLYWLKSEKEWSCRDDKVSSEYPAFWYSPIPSTTEEKCPVCRRNPCSSACPTNAETITK